MRVGAVYRYRVGNYILPTTFRVEGHNGTHWVTRSQDSFEAEIYADDDGRHVGSRDFGMYETPVNVFFVLEDDDVEVVSGIAATLLVDGTSEANNG